MFGFQTLACLHDIPGRFTNRKQTKNHSCLFIVSVFKVVRSSTNKLQDVYSKAKGKSVLIRLPCSVAESIADKSLQIAVTVANPLVKPLRGPGMFLRHFFVFFLLECRVFVGDLVRALDEFAVEKIRQIEAKYPLINTSADKVIHSLNEKTEPVRHVINTVKDTTTSTIQHGKDTVKDSVLYSKGEISLHHSLGFQCR